MIAVANAVWPACVGALAVLYASLGDGAWTRRSAIAWMMGSWGARFTVQALYAGGPQDFLVVQTSCFRLAVFALFFSLPALFASQNPQPWLGTTELAACGLWVIAFAGETTADRQLLRFRKSADGSAGQACHAGLWRFLPEAHAAFEALMWTAFALFATASPWGWIASACPAVMIYLLWVRRRC